MNFDRYKYKWIWVKNTPTNFVHAKNAPMHKFEEILIFSDGVINHPTCTTRRMKYNPQGVVPCEILKDNSRITKTQIGRGKFKGDVDNFYHCQGDWERHGGSGRIKPDRVIDSHGGIPRKGEPLSIIDHKNSFTGIIDKRAFFDENGNIYLEIHTTNHGNAKNHPYGKTGEHAHDITFKQGEKPKSYARELSEKERKDNGDIL